MTPVRTTARTAALLGGLLLLAAATAPSAAAAPPTERPNDASSCVAQVFVPQALAEPGTVADRIAELRPVVAVLDVTFGQAISDGLAHQDFCRGD